MSYPRTYHNPAGLTQYPPVSKEVQEQRDVTKSIAAAMELLTEKIRKMKGQVFGYTLSLIQDDLPTYIDFEVVGHSVNAGQIRTPGVLLFGLRLTNIGAGTVTYSVNMYQGETGSAILLNGDSVEFHSDRPLYKSLNLRAIGGNVQINVTMMS